MRSNIKEYDMYKAGEYNNYSSQADMNYWKLFDKIEDEELKKQILRQNDVLNKKHDIEDIFLISACIILGGFFGYLIGYGHGLAIKVAETISGLI